MQIDLSHLPKITSKHFYPLYSNSKKYLILYGGISSGKSVFCCQKILLRILTENISHRVLVVRKIGEKIRQSVFAEMVNTIKDWGLLPHAIVTTSPMEIRFPSFNNSTILFTGIDNEEKIKSISRISAIFIEEATELTEKDFDEVIDRFRTDFGVYKQVLISFNPISKNHWLKKKFFDSEDLKDETSIDHSTYLHNDYINIGEFGESLKKRYRNNTNAYNVKVLGLFGNDSQGGEFYSSFNHGTNTGYLNYDPDYPLILSFDFNTLPFSACLIAQLVGNELRMIDEIALESPNNRPINVIKEFKRLYPYHKTGIWITGDASGKNESVRTAAGVNDYTLIFNELKGYVAVRDFVPGRNANVFQRGEFINTLFQLDLDVRVMINENCENLIEDLVNVKKAEDGTKLKKRIKDKTTGQSFEEYGHFSDAFDYAVCSFLKSHFTKFLNANEETILSIGERHEATNLF